jgi:hypothetical protein
MKLSQWHSVMNEEFASFSTARIQGAVSGQYVRANIFYAVRPGNAALWIHHLPIRLSVVDGVEFIFHHSPASNSYNACNVG